MGPHDAIVIKFEEFERELRMYLAEFIDITNSLVVTEQLADLESSINNFLNLDPNLTKEES